MTRAMAQRYRKAMVDGARDLPDEEALQTPMLFPRWRDGARMTAGERIYDDGVLYTVLITHTAQSDWRPADAPSLFVRVLVPDPEIIPDWVQPDSTNPYMRGDKVRHVGKVWESLIDGNIWEPGSLGTEALWMEVE